MALAYSCTSAKVTSDVKTCSTSGWLRTRRARAPRTAESRTLASATSLTLALSPGLEVGDDLICFQSALTNLPTDLRTKHGKQLPFQFNRKTGFRSREEHARQTPAASHQNWISRTQQDAGIVTKLADSTYFHVATRV